MAGGNARVRLAIDTRKAKGDLRNVAKEGAKTAGKVNDSLGGGFGRSAMTGAIAGAGFGLAQRAASRVGGFMPDAISEATVGIRARIDDAFGGPEARAARGAREATKASYAEIIGRMKDPKMTDQARSFFNTVKAERMITERGNSAIDKDTGAKTIKDAFGGIVEAITKGFSELRGALPTGGK